MMICEICGKEEAVICINQISGNKKVELSLCKRCAEKNDIIIDNNVNHHER